MSHSTLLAPFLSNGFVATPRVLACALAAFAMVGTATAAPASPQAAPASSQSAGAPPRGDVDHRLIKPGDRTCLRQTGSLIPPQKGACLPVAGRSYSGQELRNTGAIDNAHALQMLDPSISLGH